MKKLIIPLILIIHCICNMIYYKFGDCLFGWGVFFHAEWAIFSALVCLTCAFVKLDKNDKVFLMVGFSYLFIMGVVFILNYFQIVNRSSDVSISVGSLLLMLILLITSI